MRTSRHDEKAIAPTRRPGEIPAQRRAFLLDHIRNIALTGVTNGVGKALSASSRVRVFCLGGTVAMKRFTITAARRIVVLADASKFGAAVFCRICEPAAVDDLITDDRADPDEIARAQDLGLVVKVFPSMRGTTQAVA